MIKVYGIPNCDTVKKARKELEANEVEYEFIDFKKVAPTTKFLKKCRDFHGDWPVNPRGRTFREYKEEFQASDDLSKIALMIKKTSILKRPIVEQQGEIYLIGYDSEKLKQL